MRYIFWGIGLLLLGIHLLEESLKKLFWTTIKQWLSREIRSPLHWRAIGTTITPILQSSSLVSLLLVAFVWSGVITFYQSLWVIFGMNTWITFIPLLLWWVWFWWWNLAMWALPLIFVWWIGYTLIKQGFKKHLSYFLLWLWVLFLSIVFIKDGVWVFTDLLTIDSLRTLPLIVYFLLWVVVTAMIQSSLAVIVLALSAVDGWIVSIPVACALVIWSNIGTTTTSMIGALWSNKNKRRVSWAHFLFNCLLATHALLFLNNYINLIEYFFAWLSHPLLLATFNVLINSITALLLLPFTRQFEKLLNWFVPAWKNSTVQALVTSRPEYHTRRLTLVVPKVAALVHDLQPFITSALIYCGYLFVPSKPLTHESIDQWQKKNASIDYEKSVHIQLYEETKTIANNLLLVLESIDISSVGTEEKEQLALIERIILLTLRANKSIKNIHHDRLDMLQYDDPAMEAYCRNIVTTVIDRLSEIDQGTKDTTAVQPFHTLWDQYKFDLSSQEEDMAQAISLIQNVWYYSFDALQSLQDASKLYSSLCASLAT